MAKLIPLLLALLGIGAGIGAGLLLKEPRSQEELSSPCGEMDPSPKADEKPKPEKNADNVEYVKLTNQFIVPVVSEGRISAMMVLALSVEVDSGKSENVYSHEPKLRDAFLQVLFDHANNGGFAGSFTSSPNMDVLRRALRETGQSLFGNLVRDILITDIARQDV